MTIVPPAGPVPNGILLVGEAPGAEEARRGQPFVGPSGRAQDDYLSRFNLYVRDWRRTNVVQEFTLGNPDPTPEQIERWTPELLREVEECRPRIILTIGRFATQWFLGEDATMELTHGIPHRAGDLDPSRRDRAPESTIILPITHPAAGFYDGEARVSIAWDYERAAKFIEDIRKGRAIETHADVYAGVERYEDVSGTELALHLSFIYDEAAANHSDFAGAVAIDTEGVESEPWSIQVAAREGESWVLRFSQPDFEVGIGALQRMADEGYRVVLHNAMYDLPMCRAMGLELRHARLFDTMYAAYLLRLEPQGLKPLAWRWCGMRMSSYQDVVGRAGAARQLEYLESVIELTESWPKPPATTRTDNAGVTRPYQPQRVYQRARAIAMDCWMQKTDKDGNLTDPYARWQEVDEDQRSQVEEEFGRPMLPTSIADVEPLEDAIAYAARDADATLRLMPRLETALAQRDLTKLMAHGMDVLPVFEEMQATGMPASRRAFERLRDSMTERMIDLQYEISHEYFSDRPFNPKSPKDVASLLIRRGLEPAKRTDTGAMSTGKTSIEHLRVEDDAVDKVLLWREHQHTRDMFAEPTLALMRQIPGDDDIVTMHCTLKPTRTPTRRLASTDPNWLAMPKHSEFGRMVRDCYVAPPGMVFLECDLSQIEMRLLAHESNEPNLVRPFIEGRDLHRETAARMFAIPSESVTADQRSFAKRINFGVAYGISGYGMAAQLRVAKISGWDEVACDKFIRLWLKTNAVCARYFDDVERSVVKTGEVRDYWGMVRYLPGVWADDDQIAAEARRQAVNHRIQGGAQGMIQNSMRWLRPEIGALQNAGLDVRWVLQVHDALMFLVPEDIVEVVRDLVLEGLTEHAGIRLRVPTLADAKWATTWGGLGG